MLSEYEKHIYKVVAVLFFIIVVAISLSFGRLIAEAEAKTVTKVIAVETVVSEPTIDLKQEIVVTTEETTAEAEELIPSLDIPLSQELIEYIWEMSKKYEIEYELIVSVIAVESNFDVDAKSKTSDYGLMQINKVNHGWLKEQYGFTDFSDPYQNIEAGCIILKDCVDNMTDYHQALMAYNMGQSRAKSLIRQGTYSSKYSRKVMAKYYEYKSMEASKANTELEQR